MNTEAAFITLFLVAATAGLAIFVRALPWPKSWLAVKPLACPMCMSGWSGFAVLGYAHATGLATFTWAQLPLMWLVLVGLAAPVFKALYPPDIELPLP